MRPRRSGERIKSENEMMYIVFRHRTYSFIWSQRLSGDLEHGQGRQDVVRELCIRI